MCMEQRNDKFNVTYESSNDNLYVKITVLSLDISLKELIDIIFYNVNIADEKEISIIVHLPFKSYNFKISSTAKYNFLIEEIISQIKL